MSPVRLRAELHRWNRVAFLTTHQRPDSNLLVLEAVQPGHISEEIYRRFVAAQRLKEQSITVSHDVARSSGVEAATQWEGIDEH